MERKEKISLASATRSERGNGDVTGKLWGNGSAKGALSLEPVRVTYLRVIYLRVIKLQKIHTEKHKKIPKKYVKKYRKIPKY